MDPIRLLEFLASKPRLLLPLIALLAAWHLTKLFLKAAERFIASADFAIIAPQFVAFALITHVMFSCVAAITCWWFTELPPPLVSPRGPITENAELDRAFGFYTCIVGAALSILGYLRPRPFVFAMLRPDYALFGVTAAIALTAYAAIVEPTPFSPPPEFQSTGEAIAWWYLIVPISSFSLSLLGYLLTKLLYALWRLAGKLAHD